MPKDTDYIYSTLLNNIPHKIFYKDLDSVYLLCNKSYARDLKIKPAQIKGKTDYDFFPKKLAKKYRTDDKAIIRKGETREIEEKYIKDGVEKVVHTLKAPVRDNEKNIVGIFGIFWDITEYKKTEEALRSLKDNLEIEVEKKTKELIMAYKDLENSKRLADIGALAAIVAHELRNPLGVIKTAVYNIKHKGRDRSIVSHLNNIDKKITESDTIIKNLLSYSKVMVPQYRSVLICDLITECVRNFKAKYSMFDLTVSMRCGCKKRDRIEADPVHITSLFSNILDNSYQSFYGEKGVIDIKSIYKRADNSLRIAFKDNGSGISKSDLDKLFEPFFTTKAKGIGLGLTVCKQIINLHNGKIDITSKKSQGTTVSIALPINRK